MEELTEYEIQKAKHKRLLVRNEYRGAGKYDVPLALQIESVFKNRWCGAYWQSQGLNVIPTVAWGDERTFDFCFDGIEQGSIVAVCTYYRENCEDDFYAGL